MRYSMFAAALALFTVGPVGGAQSAPAGGTITGTVLDADGRPIPGVSVTALPNIAHAETDSAGRFSLARLDGGFYRVRARRIGYVAEVMTTDLSKNGHVDIKFELRPRPAILDSVVVQEHGNCPSVSYTGFNCRKRFGKGVYLTDDDIADKGAIELGDIFDGVPGFRIEIRATMWGQKPVPIPLHGARCLNALVNGRPFALTNPLPLYANELLAVEIYASPSDVPSEYQRYVWDASIRQSRMPVGRDSPDDRCSLVVYWTSFA